MKNYFLNWFKNLRTSLRMVINFCLGVINVAILGVVLYAFGAFSIDVIVLVSSAMGQKFSYAGFVAPFVAITGLLSFVYKHLRENAQTTLDKLIPVLEDLIRLKDMKNLTKNKKALINKLEANILLTKQDSIITGFNNYLSSKDNKYLDAVIDLLKHEIRIKSDFYYGFFYYLEIMLRIDRIKELREEKIKL